MLSYMSKSYLEDTIKLSILKWVDHPVLSWWIHCNHRVHIRNRQRQGESKAEKEMWQKHQKSEWCVAMSQKNVGSFKKLEKGKEIDSSLESPEGTQSCLNLDCSPTKLIFDLWLPECEMRLSRRLVASLYNRRDGAEDERPQLHSSPPTLCQAPSGEKSETKTRLLIQST